jgi:hypothetical protein
MSPRIIYDEVKSQRGSKWIMVTLFAVLMGVLGLARWGGK